MPKLTVRGEPGRISGALLDPDGRPVPGAEVLLKAEGGSASILSVRRLAGVVPEAAATALFALRINTECNCSGPADLTLAEMRYRDGVQSHAASFPAPSGRMLNQTPAGLRLMATGSDRLALNTKEFTVSPGARFTAEIPLGITTASAGSGYIALIFLNRQGREMRRERLAFSPGEMLLGKAVTDRSGRFQLQPDARPAIQEQAVRAEFPGNASLRGASAALR